MRKMHTLCICQAFRDALQFKNDFKKYETADGTMSWQSNIVLYFEKLI